MRHFRALFVLLFACSLWMSGLPIGASTTVAAQEGGSGDGAAVSVTDEEGTAVGTITVTNVVDSFTEFDPAYPPEEGSRFVVVNVAFDADAGARFDIAPYTIVL
ncbi:MAG TPA: hypothetical protein VK356_00195 [Thermomicrobiales bacterium]|nr:hypothetical protein [Thermomicrobiales bacterium]